MDATKKAIKFMNENPAEAAKGMKENQLKKTDLDLLEAGLKSMLGAFPVDLGMTDSRVPCPRYQEPPGRFSPRRFRMSEWRLLP